MEKITKSQAKKMLEGLEPQVFCYSPIRNIRWNGEFNLKFDNSFHVIAVCDFVDEGDHYSPIWSEVIFERFQDSDGGILTIITPHDTRVRGNWGVISGMTWREERIYRVI